MPIFGFTKRKNKNKTKRSYPPTSIIDKILPLCYNPLTLNLNTNPMRKDIHPTVNNVIFLDTSCGAEFFGTSTLHSKETRTVDGVEYMILNIEISSASHPFYTGKQILVDTARRIEKFDERSTRVAAAAGTRKGKALKHAAKTAARKAKMSGEEK